jgi:hypothetical protein
MAASNNLGSDVMLANFSITVSDKSTIPQYPVVFMPSVTLKISFF